jgi:tetratricopeptide (TPR) repeat protein
LLRLARRQHGWRTLLVCLLVLGLAATAILYWDQYQLTRLQQALAAADGDRAERHWQRCLALWLSPGERHLLAARLARVQEDYVRAQAELELGANLPEQSAEVLLERCLCRAEQGDIDWAERKLRSGGAIEPAQAAALRTALARGLLCRHNPVEAQLCAEQALQLQPDHAPALVCRGQARELLHQYETALTDYQRAYTLAPHLPGLRLRLAETLYRAGFVWEAAEHFASLRSQQPDNPEVLLGLVRCQHDLAKTEEAWQQLGELLERFPQHQAALLERGRWALRRQQFTEAETCLQHLVKLAPGNLEAQRLLQQCVRDQGREDAQLEARVQELERATVRVSGRIEQALNGQPTAQMCQEIGTALLQLDRDEEGLTWLYTALKMNPRQCSAHAALADYYRRRGQEVMAQHHAELAKTAQGPGFTPAGT